MDWSGWIRGVSQLHLQGGLIFKNNLCFCTILIIMAKQLRIKEIFLNPMRKLLMISSVRSWVLKNFVDVSKSQVLFLPTNICIVVCANLNAVMLTHKTMYAYEKLRL